MAIEQTQIAALKDCLMRLRAHASHNNPVPKGILDDIAATLRAMPTTESAEPVAWIPVTERLPDAPGKYWVFEVEGFVARWDGVKWKDVIPTVRGPFPFGDMMLKTQEREVVHPTHWMPLPPAPGEAPPPKPEQPGKVLTFPDGCEVTLNQVLHAAINPIDE